mgnify:CR=1 FL=1
MVCEGLFNLFGTSSEEIIARAKQESKMQSDQYYLPKINELSTSVSLLSSQMDYLKNLLKQNNIPFDSELMSGDGNISL